jgi:thiamine pyridinylase
MAYSIPSWVRRVVAALCVAVVAAATLGAPAPAPAQDRLTVGLFPYVPRPQQFRDAIGAAWEARHPDIEIVYDESWDGGYSQAAVPADIDVFVFDAMFLYQYWHDGFLAPIRPDEVTDPDDFVAYALEHVVDDDGNFRALPMLGCANILFYQRGDALADATTLAQVGEALGQCQYTSIIPPNTEDENDRGLMVDMHGRTTTAAFHLDIHYSQTGEYPLPLPEPEEPTLAAQRLVVEVASRRNANYSVPPDMPYQMARWFDRGFGRAWIGYTESLSQIRRDLRDTIDFRPMPFGDGTHPPLFFADMVAVNPHGANRDRAVELANLMTSRDVMVEAIGVGTDASGNPRFEAPQFLLPARGPVFDDLAYQDPIYDRFAAMLDRDPRLFTFEGDIRSWLDDHKTAIRRAVMNNIACGCDFPLDRHIPNDAVAHEYCDPVCDGHGGWSGEWTNDPPHPDDVPAVCGCNACPPVTRTVDPTPRLNY